VKIASDGRHSGQPHKFLRLIHGLYPGKKDKVAFAAQKEANPAGFRSSLVRSAINLRNRLAPVLSFSSQRFRSGRRSAPAHPGHKKNNPKFSQTGARAAGGYGWRSLLANERWLNRIRTAMIYLLILVLSQAAARLTWALLSSQAVFVPETVAAVEPVRAVNQGRGAATGTKAELGEKLASLHLFGKASPVIVEIEPTAMMEAPATTLNLTLRGLISAMPEDRALAIISEKSKDGKDTVYAMGEEVPGKAVIHGIYADRVILLRAGKLETLYLETEEGNRSREPARPVAAGRQRVSRDYVQDKLANLPDLAREVGVQVHTRNGVQYGFQLVSVQGSDFLNNLGLQAGDILYEVNGIRLSDASSALTAYEQLREARDIQLVIERDGTRQTKTFSIQ
jgi:general secretion pathway protein C